MLLTAACNQGKLLESPAEFLEYTTDALTKAVGGMNPKSEIARRNAGFPGNTKLKRSVGLLSHDYFTRDIIASHLIFAWFWFQGIM